VGTGSGCIAVALAVHLPEAAIVAVDTSAEALEVARQNVERHGVAGRVRLAHGDLHVELDEPADLIVSNPPYIPTGDIAGLVEVRDHDPAKALDGGADGLDAYRTIAGQAARLLKPGGHIVVELGIGQDASVASLFRAAGLAPRPAHTDLSGIPRALCAAV